MANVKISVLSQGCWQEMSRVFRPSGSPQKKPRCRTIRWAWKPI